MQFLKFQNKTSGARHGESKKKKKNGVNCFRLRDP